MDDLREKLFVLIGEVQDEGRDYSECFCKGDRPGSVSNYVLADHLIANGVTVTDGKDTDVPTGWIPAAERLPDLKSSPCDVLVIHELKGDMLMDVAWYSYDKRRWCSCNGMNLKVTHWRPLPEPPKGE